MATGGVPRRAVYFAFQGLFMAVLLLLFLYQGRSDGWGWGFALLAALTVGSLAALRLVSEAALGRWWLQAGLFVGDALVATAVLRWLGPRNELFLIYFLIVLGSALTRNPRQNMAIAAATIALYALAWPGRLPMHTQAFWLIAVFLATTSALLAVLALDAKAAQDEEKRRYDEKLIQAERLATLGRMAAEVAHRIKGPLTTISVDAEVLSQRHAGEPATVRELEQIRDEVLRCKEILKSLLDLGRIEEMDEEPLDLRVPIRRAVDLVGPQARDKRVKLRTSGLDAELPARGDVSLVQEAVFALLQNAVEAVGPGGSVAVEASAAPGRLLVTVVDDGSGIDAEHLDRIFQPFFTTKKTGSGLGLSAAQRIALKHGGSLEARSDGPGRGARFLLVLPRR